MNVQGDEPGINVDDIKNLDDKTKKYKSEIGTLAAKISNFKIYSNKNIVKVKTKESFDQNLFHKPHCSLE